MPAPPPRSSLVVVYTRFVIPVELGTAPAIAHANPMFLSWLLQLDSARTGMIQLPGLLPSTGRIASTASDLSLGASALLIGLAVLLVWAVLRHTS